MIHTQDSSGWTCVAYNPISGVSTWLKPDGDEDLLVQERQDIRALLDENQALRSIAAPDWKGDGLHSVARIPLAMLHDDQSLLGGAVMANDDKVVARLLNDSDYRKLRTKDGRI